MTEQKQIIMIVDDTPTNLQILIEIMKDEYEIVVATNGRDALVMAERNLPDLILLDIQMQEMDGYEVCKALKQMPSQVDIPVIFVTAMSQQEDEALGLNLGAVDYITKPINPELVQLRIKNHLELKRQNDQLREQMDLIASQNQVLKDSIKRVKHLEGIIPICMYCKKIRDDNDSWHKLENYITDNSDAMFSHGVCQDCFNKALHSKDKVSGGDSTL